MTATVAPPSPSPTTRAAPGAGLVTATVTVAGRTIRQFVRTPQLLVVSTVQGAMFLLIFRYVFGGAIQAGGLDYVDFLVPGFLVSGILFTGASAAAGVAEDTETGVHDRLRSLPIPRVAIVAGRSLADAALLVWGTGVTAVLGYAVGFRTGSRTPGVGVRTDDLGGVGLDPGTTRGRFTSRILDAQQMVDWTRLTYRADLPAGTSLTFSVRTGSSLVPSSSWTRWAPVEPGGRIGTSGRYVQYQVDFSASPTSSNGPVLREVGITHGGEAPIRHRES